ncbi:MAG: glycosyltransferase family 4 protein [Proteobacteria bacterium]|nr:glycosyltransferase family 4 protein [Pseudomonadota bacterium]HQR04138.1 glycosyltransferase family 4 protein [Rhodocyclaceae bacterium]
MKLALVRQKYNPFGGAERFVERALEALRGRGVEVSLITRRWKAEDGLPVRLCNPFHLGRLWRDAGFCRGVQRIVAGGEFDLVQSHERIPGCHIYRAGDGVHATWLEYRARTESPLARWFTRLHPWHRYTLRAETALFRHPALRAVICNSSMVRDDILRRFDVAAEKLHVIHNGVDLERFHPGLRARHRTTVRAALDIPQGAPLVLYVGSGFVRKGVPALLQALAHMPEHTHLLVVGKDKGAAAMATLAQRLGLASQVRFIGGQTDVTPYYGAADVFALPTIYDPFPNAVLEALACGLPVLTTPGSGAAELLTAECGAVADALDAAAIAAELSTLLTLPAAATARAARRMAETCSSADMGARLLALYEGLMKG